MRKEAYALQKIREEIQKTERDMEDLYFLKRIVEGLKAYREMIKFNEYD